MSQDYLLKVYKDIPYKTAEEVMRDADRMSRQRAKELRIGIGVILAWAVAVPMLVAVLGWASPMIGLLVTVYALGKAFRRAGLILGWFKQSSFEKNKQDKESRKNHYYYHCERNPEGFQRIRAENFGRDERERVHREADELTGHCSCRPKRCRASGGN